MILGQGLGQGYRVRGECCIVCWCVGGGASIEHGVLVCWCVGGGPLLSVACHL